MTQLSTYSDWFSERMISRPAAWLVSGAFVIVGVLAAALIGAAFGTPRSGSITDTVAPEQSSIGMTIGPSAPEVIRVAIAAPVAALGQKSFAFGYLEFDWDPNALGGVPGFDSWPNRELRVPDASAGE